MNSPLIVLLMGWSLHTMDSISDMSSSIEEEAQSEQELSDIGTEKESSVCQEMAKTEYSIVRTETARDVTNIAGECFSRSGCSWLSVEDLAVVSKRFLVQLRQFPIMLVGWLVVCFSLL